MVTWMAGGGTKGGAVHGVTDDIGMAAVQDRVSIPDWHATMLHALEDSGQRYGLQSMCEAGGMANATIIERL